MPEGACLCGTVRFAVAPPYRWFACCHCSMCRRHHGALFGAGVGVERARLRWHGGEDAIVGYRSTGAFERSFCGRCGAKVPAVSHLDAVVHVPAGALDGLDDRPRTHIFLGSRSPLFAGGDDLRRFDAYPPGVDVPAVPRSAAAHRDETARRGEAVVGECLCGRVGYEVREPPARLVHCHCSLCRRSRGGPCSTTAEVAAARFEWTRGADAVRTYRRAGPGTYRVDFCRDCGSLLPGVRPEQGVVHLQAGALDGIGGPLPGMHLHVASKARWDVITDPWPRAAEAHPEGP